MIPVLFDWGPVQIHSFGVMIALGLLISIFLMKRRAVRDGFPSPVETAVDLVFVAIAGGFLGARLHYVFQFWGEYSQNPVKIFAVWEGGLIFYGGVAGAVTALLVFMKIKRIPALAGLDFLVPYVALTHAFGRIGCFLNGCCYGRACDLPWAVTFPSHPYPVHPTQLYESLFDVLLFCFLTHAYDKRRFKGQILFFYLIFYAAGRFGIEFFRGDNPIWFHLTSNQWVSLAVLFLSVFFYGRLRHRNADRKH